LLLRIRRSLLPPFRFPPASPQRLQTWRRSRVRSGHHGIDGRLIEEAKCNIWSIATPIAESNPDAEIRMGLVAYRDISDEYVTKTFDLTTDIQGLYANLLELKARGGADWPESVNEALDVAANKLRWTPAGDVRWIVFLVGDAPPHMDPAQDTKYPTTLAAAKQKDIIVNAVLAGNARDTERVWRDIAQNGNGRFIPIPQDGNALNEKLAALVAKSDKYVAEACDKPPPKASSFDRVVEDTVKAQIKR
jgi:hypothetical protein